jgi:hypothetical protein
VEVSFDRRRLFQIDALVDSILKEGHAILAHIWAMTLVQRSSWMLGRMGDKAPSLKMANIFNSNGWSEKTDGDHRKFRRS